MTRKIARPLILLAWALSAPAADAADAEFLQVGTGKAKLNALLQSWALADSTSSAAHNNYRIRRAEIKLSGSFSPETRWSITTDPAKSLKAGAVAAANDNKIIQDLLVGYKLGEAWELMLGQFKILTVAESLDSSSDLLMPERSMLSREFGDKRQTGVQVGFKQGDWKAGLMLSNGGSANADDSTTPKDLSLRVDYAALPQLGVGGFVYAADTRVSDYGRWGLNARWKGEAESLRVEYVNSEDSATGTRVNSTAFVADAGYKLTSVFQPVLRFEKLVPDTNADLSSRAFALGLNALLSGNASKIQASYTFLWDATGKNGSYEKSIGLGSGRVFVVSFQAAI